MNPITVTLTKIRTKRRILNLGVLLVFILMLIGGYFLVFKGGPSWRVAQVFPEKKVEEELPEVVITPPEKVEAPTQPKVYEEVAESGEGITHLARKALKKYLQEKGEGLNLTPEHKIYIEDYLQKKTGDYWLQVGQKLTFSEELIKEAIEKAQTLSEEQLQNLSQYAKLVPELNY